MSARKMTEKAAIFFLGEGREPVRFNVSGSTERTWTVASKEKREGERKKNDAHTHARTGREPVGIGRRRGLRKKKQDVN